ncbi:sigma-70 family RNA polymerase sigma factor [Paenibacillus sp. IB182496]|uniref:Sigma-70 family RNA polymerase sigma factor n=1 Tax=Paenibacillus sabuli TaxID=2772509 RepID=A0A927BXH9_9BACL|nr:sigma-70 family RNA polymerase sigma factor [Paenibacillus sabuli]MBD2848167.1 sigma-70 family RNA polymerase sigma factor [Paenibacillus sabuli]
MNETAQPLRLFDDLKPELTSYCYRMLGSIDDADDAVQETFIRVWQGWDAFRQESSFKTWVYRIASNLCLDKLRQAKRRVRPIDLSGPAQTIVEPREVLPDESWIWPAPDFSNQPEQVFFRRDTLHICFVTLLQLLPPRQRAAILLKDVFEWSAKEIAETLGMSPAAVNSALQRARATLEREQQSSDAFSVNEEAPDQELLARYVEAFEQFDINALVALFHEEGQMSMPPFPMWVRGKEDLFQFFTLTRGHCEGSRFLPISANGGYPALAQYMPDKEADGLVPWGIHMLEVRDNKILHVQNFIHQKLFSRFGLPERIHR